MTRKNTTSLYRLQLVREADYPYDLSTLSSPAAAAKFFRPLFEGIDREQMAVAFLDAKHRVIGVGIVSIGSLTASIVHPREVFKPAVLSNASAVLICHNHPSGVPEPSPEDISLTSRLSQAGDILGIRLLDHVILGDDSHYSFVDSGHSLGSAAIT
jgi:DNA repair protein RadC